MAFMMTQRLLLHHRLCSFYNVSDAVDETFLLRRQDELIMHHYRSNVFRVVAIEVKFEGDHLIIVSL